MNNKNILIIDEWYSKYIKYKNKYIKLKNQEGGYLNESQKKRLNELNIDGRLIRDLEMLDSKEEVINEIIKSYEENIYFDIYNKKLSSEPIIDIFHKILFNIESKEYKLEEFGLMLQNNLISRGYFSKQIPDIKNTPMLFGTIYNNRTKIDIYKDKIIYIDILTGENIVSSEDLKNVFNIMNYILIIRPKYTPSELVCYIYDFDIKRLSSTKPVATLPSGDYGFIFKGNWDDYTEAEKKEVEILLSIKHKNEIKIFRPIGKNMQVVFYIPENFKKLCEKFDFNVDKGLGIIAKWDVSKPVMEMYFIKCAFDNSYDDIDEYIKKNGLDPKLCDKS